MSAFLQGFAAGATPGIEAGIGGMNDQKAANKQGQAIATDMSQRNPTATPDLQAANAASDAANPELQAAFHPMADPSHPVWGVMGAAAGAPPTDPAAAAGASPISGMAEGGIVGAAKGPLPANFGGARGYQNGGSVQRYGVPTKPLPMFAGPAAGVTPGSTEGQVLTMDQGGAVPMGMPQSGTNMMGVPGQGAPPMTGRNAGISAGLPAGMAMGHNLMEQFRQSQQRSSADDALAAQQKADLDSYRQSHGLPTTDDQEAGGGLMGTVHKYADHVLHMFHEKSLDDQHNPNQPLEGSPNFKQPGAVPAPAAAPQPTGGGPGAPGAVGSPGSAPSPLGAAAPSPAAAAGQKAAAGAQQATGNPDQAAASATAVGAATQDPNARQGIPQQSPDASGKAAHSLTSKDWEDMEQAKFKAARAAVRAGMDGTQVYQALSAMQTSHFQGQYIKNLGAAQQALAKGDYDGMEKAMKSANYYLPNGKDLDLHKATAEEAEKNGVPVGTPMVTNPFYGMPGHEGSTQMVPINSTSLNNFATAALDPRAFAAGQLDQYKAGVSAQKELMQGKAAMLVGKGRSDLGSAAMGKMYDDMAKTPSVISNNKSLADLHESQAAYWKSKSAGTGGGVKIKPSDVARAQQDAAKAVDDSAQGPLTTTPPYMMGPDGKPMTDPTTGQPVPNPHGNQPMHDPAKVSPLFQGMSAQERDQTKAIAGEIHAANLSNNVSAQQAAEIAARLTADNREVQKGHVPTHINPQNGKAEKNVVDYQAKGGDGKMYPAKRIWADGHYITVWATANVGTDEAGPTEGISTGGGAGSSSSGASSGSDETQEERNLTG